MNIHSLVQAHGLATVVLDGDRWIIGTERALEVVDGLLTSPSDSVVDLGLLMDDHIMSICSECQRFALQCEC